MSHLAVDQEILLASVCYLALLFVVAWLADRRKLPEWLLENPVVQVLALGAFASAWTFYGVVDLASQYGYGALSYSMGVGGLFVFAPLVLMPLFRLSRTYQLHSLADVLVFRFRAPWVGVFTTACMLLAALPLLALQIQAVADSALVLSYRPNTDRGELLNVRDKMALIFCVAVWVFAALFGAGREHHRGLVAAMAVESVFKLTALMAVGWFALHDVFGGLQGLENWLSLHPEQIETLYLPVEATSSHMLVLLFFATAVVSPNMFHMVFTENRKMSTLRHASWGMPLYMLGLSLPVLPILWAGFALGAAVEPEYFTLGVPLSAGNTGLTALAFWGGLSAAAGTTIVMAMALSTMCLNHWLLPRYQLSASKTNLYGLLTWLRRALLALILSASYLFYALLHNHQNLTELAILAFIGTLQFLPAVFAVLYRPQANRWGLLASVGSGTLIWLLGLVIPTLLGLYSINLLWTGWSLPLGMPYWSEITSVAIACNVFLFVVVSRNTRTSADEQRAAEQCSMDEVSRPLRLELDVRSVEEMGERLAQALGQKIAQTELARALADIEQPMSDARPYALRRLRDRLEANLSGLMGAAVAHATMDRAVPYHTAVDAPLKEDLHFVENRINQYRHHLTGLAAELDTLRRHHRQTLESLPMAACSFGDDGEVLLWNRAMAQLTNISTETVLGSSLAALQYPWSAIFDDFLRDTQSHARKQRIEIDGQPRWLNLHKASLSADRLGASPADAHNENTEGQILMIEDFTETELLERELMHNERLASIGLLAAGVAHEVGNPVTGIACLAQNLKYDSDEPEVVDAARQILGQTARITRIVQSLVHFAHTGSEKGETREAVDLFECVEEAIHLLSLQKDRTPVFYNNLMAPDTLISGDEQKMTQLFINLFSNASDASDAQSPIDISANTVGDKVFVRVRDYGHGISPAHIKRLFEPFFTTKPTGHGTGLGLSLVYSIVEEHGGHIDVQSPVENGIGTEFVVVLPVLCSLVRHDKTGGTNNRKTQLAPIV